MPEPVLSCPTTLVGLVCTLHAQYLRSLVTIELLTMRSGTSSCTQMIAVMSALRPATQPAHATRHAVRVPTRTPSYPALAMNGGRHPDAHSATMAVRRMSQLLTDRQVASFASAPGRARTLVVVCFPQSVDMPVDSGVRVDESGAQTPDSI